MKFSETKTVVAMWEDRTMKTIQEKQIIVRTWRIIVICLEQFSGISAKMACLTKTWLKTLFQQ